MIDTREIAVCTVSGGLDSAVAAAIARSRGLDLYLLFFRYGQKTQVKEQECLEKLAQVYNPKEVRIVDLPWVKDMGDSALLEPNVPLNERNFRLEYVPARNTIFWAAATALAEVVGASSIYIGSSGGDHICPDNSPQFITAFQEVIRLGTMLKTDIKLIAPLIDTDKIGAVKMGTDLGVPFELTWSCHNNIDLACGHCSNCKSRIEAFQVNGMSDPIPHK